MPRLVTSRRTFLRSSAAAAGILCAPNVLRRAYAQEPFTVRVPGGYGDNWDRIFFTPFAEATGIHATSVVSQDHPFNEMKLSVETGAYRWSMAGGITKDLYFRLNDIDLLETIDTDSPAIQVREASTYSDKWLPYATYAYTLVYRTEQFENPLTSFVDMWNIEKFPGRRSLRNRAVDAIEQVMRGIGTPPEEIYTVLSSEDGWDRAFAGLDEIYPDIDVWWSSDPQLDQIVGSGDLHIFPMSSHRAQREINAGVPLEVVYNQGYFTSQGWAIPKGSPQADVARDFIKFAAEAEREAEFAQAVLMGPMNPDAFEFINEDVGRTLPTHPNNISQMVEQDPKFWLENVDYASTRFDEWLLSKG